MKRSVGVLLAIMLCVTVPRVYAATASAEYRLIHKNGHTTPAMFLSAASRFPRSTLGSFTWGRVQEHYAQAYAGPTWTPLRNVTVGAGIGLEQNSQLLRIAQFVSVDSLWRNGSLYLLQQHGGSGRYTKIDLGYRVTSWAKTGWLYETPLGSEAKLEFVSKRVPVKLWLGASSHIRQGGVVYQF